MRWAVASGSDSLIWRAQLKASPQEKAAATASTNLSNSITNNMNTSFANSQSTQGALNAQLQNLTQQGMAGQGFGTGQEANLRSDAQETSAQGNLQAEQAANQRNATAGQTSGGVAAQNATLASNAAAQNAGAQRGITDQNAQLANNKVTSGLTGLGNLAGQQTQQADSLSGTSVQGAGQSFGEETQANQPSTFWSGLGTSVLGMGLNAIAPSVGSAVSGLLGSGSPVGNSGLINAGNAQSLQGDNPDETIS